MIGKCFLLLIPALQMTQCVSGIPITALPAGVIPRRHHVCQRAPRVRPRHRIGREHVGQGLRTVCRINVHRHFRGQRGGRSQTEGARSTTLGAEDGLGIPRKLMGIGQGTVIDEQQRSSRNQVEFYGDLENLDFDDAQLSGVNSEREQHAFPPPEFNVQA